MTGPFTVTVQSVASVSGTVTTSAGSPVAGALVQDCLDTTGWEGQATTTTSTGTFSLEAGIGDSIDLSAFSPQGSALVSPGPVLIAVPADGVQGETLVLAGLHSL